jgi:hypothetical protein
MGNLLTSIGEALMAINFAALLLVLMLKQRKTAFEVIIFATMILGVGHLALEYKLYELSKQGADKGFIRAVWYLGFSATYLLHVVSCAWYCNKKKLARDKSSTIILVGFTIAATLQFLRYIDRVVIETDVLGILYTSGIPAINSICTIVIILYVVSRYVSLGKIGNSLIKLKLTSAAMKGIARWTA